MLFNLINGESMRLQPAIMLTGAILWTIMTYLVEAYIPVYTWCDGTVHISDDTPAVKLELSFNENHLDPFKSLKYFCNLTFTVVDEDYFIGVLLLDRPHQARLCQPEDGCQCDSSPFMIKYKESTKHFCNDRGVQDLDSNIKARSLTVERWLDRHWTEYTILVFRFKEKCKRHTHVKDMTRCRTTKRCIDNSLICEPPYKYCGDTSILCSGNTGSGGISNVGSSGPTIAGLVVAGILILLLGIVFYVCVGKSRECRIKRLFRRRHSSRREVRNETRRVFTVQFTSRGVTSNSQDDTGEINIAFSDGPPDYDSVIKADLGDVSDGHDVPPCYDIVMSDTHAYKVKTLDLSNTVETR